MPEYNFELDSPLLPGDTLTITDREDTSPPPPPPPTGIVYDHPSDAEVNPELPELLDSLHDPTQWPGLAVGVTHNGVREVYRTNHEHGQPYPDWARSLFGPMTAFTLGQSISYPWQTDRENEKKHEGYKYMGWDWRPYELQPRVANTGVVSAAFIQQHVMGTDLAALARIHGFFGAVLLQPPDGSPPGIVWTGGHGDGGQLTVPYKGGRESIVPLENSPQPEYPDGTPPYRGHTTLSPNDDGHTHWNSVIRRGSQRSVEETYHRLLRFAFRQKRIHMYVTGGIDTPAPTFAYYATGTNEYDPVTRHNSTTRNLYQVEVTIPDGILDANGNFRGYTDLQGRIVEGPGNDQAGPTVVPLMIENCRPGNYATNFPGPFPGPFNDMNFFHGDYFFNQDGEVVPHNQSNGRPSGWVGAKN